MISFIQQCQDFYCTKNITFGLGSPLLTTPQHCWLSRVIPHPCPRPLLTAFTKQTSPRRICTAFWLISLYSLFPFILTESRPSRSMERCSRLFQTALIRSKCEQVSGTTQRSQCSTTRFLIRELSSSQLRAAADKWSLVQVASLNVLLISQSIMNGLASTRYSSSQYKLHRLLGSVVTSVVAGMIMSLAFKCVLQPSAQSLGSD